MLPRVEYVLIRTLLVLLTAGAGFPQQTSSDGCSSIKYFDMCDPYVPGVFIRATNHLTNKLREFTMKYLESHFTHGGNVSDEQFKVFLRTIDGATIAKLALIRWTGSGQQGFPTDAVVKQSQEYYQRVTILSDSTSGR